MTQATLMLLMHSTSMTVVKCVLNFFLTKITGFTACSQQATFPLLVHCQSISMIHLLWPFRQDVHKYN